VPRLCRALFGRDRAALFAGDPRLTHLPIAYGSGGTIDDRLSVWPQLREAVCVPRSIIIDPDSRLTQLGLLPICQEEDYYLFESRAYGADGEEALTSLTRRWVAETLEIAHARPFVATGLDATEFRPRSVLALAKTHPNAFLIRSRKNCSHDCRGRS
jgi:hypothetical protein